MQNSIYLLCSQGSTAPSKSVSLEDDLTVIRAQRSLRRTLWAFIALGAILTLVNLQWPLARNALNYAKAAVEILHRHFDLFSVIGDWSATGGKPILFSLLASPFVWLTNATTGTLIASALGTAFFLYSSSLALPRLNAKARLDPGLASLELTFVAFNPLVLYQFWSGYPDALFAGFVILAFVLIDIIASEPARDTRWHIAGVGATICLAILTKLYGMILVLLCPLYVALHLRQVFAQSTYLRSKVVVATAAILVIVALLITARMKLNPLLDIGIGAGSNGYVPSFITVKDAALMLVFCLVLAFNISIALLLIPRSWKLWSAAPTLFAFVYILGLLPFSGAAYNMRYFLPAFPFVAPVVAGVARSIRPVKRRILIWTYGILAAVLVLNFNVAPVERVLRPFTTRLDAWQPDLADWLDNLRLPVQIELKKQIDTLNEHVPAGATLYWSSNYYGTVTHGLAHHLGVRDDIHVRYVRLPGEVPASRDSVFLTLFSSLAPSEEFWPTPQWATAKSLGHGVFRLDPAVLRLLSVDGDSISTGEPIRLRVTADSAISLRSLQIVEGQRSWPVDLSRSSDMVLSPPALGRHQYMVQAAYGLNEITKSMPVVVYVGTPALERSATLAGDLMVEFSDGSPLVPNDVLSLDEDNRAAGLRFEDIRVPQGAHIAEAYLSLTSASVATRPTVLEIYAALSASAGPMDLKMGTVSSRARTRAYATWQLGKWDTLGSRQSSPNLAPLLEEVFSLADWRSGNPIMLVVHVSGQTRSANVAEVDRAPSLYIRMR